MSTTAEFLKHRVSTKTGSAKLNAFEESVEKTIKFLMVFCFILKNAKCLFHNYKSWHKQIKILSTKQNFWNTVSTETGSAKLDVFEESVEKTIEFLMVFSGCLHVTILVYACPINWTQYMKVSHIVPISKNKVLWKFQSSKQRTNK